MHKLFKKKFIAFVLSFALIASVLPVNISLAAEAEDSADTQVERVQDNTAESAGESTDDIQEESSVAEEQTAIGSADGQAVPESGESTDEQASMEPQVQYIYVESPYLIPPATQKIAVSFQDGVELTAAVLVYENETTGEQFTSQASEIDGEAVMFAVDYSEDSQAATYHLLKVTVEVDGVSYDIDLNTIGIDSRYGVNQECETEPDAVVEEDSASGRSSDRTGVSATFMTFDDEGNLVENASAEDAIADASTDVTENSKARSAARATRSGNLVVVLDPGHGGSDPGALGVNGAKEKDLTLKIAQYCKTELEQYSGVTVYMTRTGDTYPGGSGGASADLTNRVTYAKSVGADVLVSIHLNSTGYGTAHGAEVYYPNSSYRPDIGSEGQNLAQKIQNELVNLGLTNRGIKIRNTENGSTYPDGSPSDYYGLIWRAKEAGFPAIIIEHAFIDNQSDYNNFLSSDAKLQSLGVADATGIAAAYGLSKGKWVQDGTGWRWQHGDGTYAKDTWVLTGGSWYYMGSDTYMLTGWQTIGGAKYYLNPVSGAMHIGWLQQEGKWYYLNASGAMVSNGWNWVGSSCYYFDKDGVMAADTWIGDYYVDASGAWVQGWVKPGWIQSGGRWWYRHKDGGYTRSNWELIDGKWYYFDASGWMTTGWQLVGNTWYYMDASGAMLTGWQTIGSAKYYLNTSGAMLTGWQQIDGKWYYFNSSGAMETDAWIGDYYVDEEGVWDTTKVKPQWILSGNRWWYRHGDGSYTKSDWEKINGQWYYFDSAGWMVTGWLKLDDTWYYLNTSGVRTSGWQLVGSTWYYMNSEGEMLTGWQTIVGARYYLDPVNGDMKTGWQLIGGKWYYLTASGAMAANTWIGNYYVDASGAMATDTWIGDYYVDENGVWVPGKVKDTGWIQSGDKWWYRHGDGSYTISNWEKIGGQWYYFDAAGWMTTGWIVVGDYWYYMDVSGAMHKGWLDESGNRYYLNLSGNGYGPEGAMATGYREIEGTWYYFNKGYSPVGALYYTGVTPIMGTSILGGDKNTVVKKMVTMYMNSKKSYPSDALGKGGADNITEFCEILYDEAVYEGVKPEVVFAQAMHETGWLQFGGDIKIEQFNFAGIGAVGGGATGASFENVAIGLRAQVQHLKAYASTEPLNRPGTPADPRFHLVTRGTAPYVEWLGINENPYGKGWAESLRYGINLVKSFIIPMGAL